MSRTWRAGQVLGQHLQVGRRGKVAHPAHAATRRCALLLASRGWRRGLILRRLRCGSKHGHGKQNCRSGRREQGSKLHGQGILSDVEIAVVQSMDWATASFYGRNPAGEDAIPGNGLRSGNAWMVRAVAKRSGSSTAWRMPMRARHQHLATRIPSSRTCSGESASSKIQAIVRCPAQCPTPGKAGWARRSVPAPLLQGPVRGYAPSAPARHRLQRAQQHAPGLAFFLAGDVHAEVAPINCINISMAGRPEDHRFLGVGPRCECAAGSGVLSCGPR